MYIYIKYRVISGNLQDAQIRTSKDQFHLRRSFQEPSNYKGHKVPEEIPNPFPLQSGSSGAIPPRLYQRLLDRSVWRLATVLFSSHRCFKLSQQINLDFLRQIS